MRPGPNMISVVIKGRVVRLQSPDLGLPKWTALARHKATWHPIAHADTREEVEERAAKSIDAFDQLIEEQLKELLDHRDPPIKLDRKDAPWR